MPDNIADSALMAITLLERNEEIIFGHWGIETIGDQECFTVFSTLVANTMDNGEFAAAVKAIINERVRIAKLLQKNAVNF